MQVRSRAVVKPPTPRQGNGKMDDVFACAFLSSSRRRVERVCVGSVNGALEAGQVASVSQPYRAEGRVGEGVCLCVCMRRFVRKSLRS